MPDLRFAAPEERRVAIVTGGANGIGRACALRLAEAGRDIVVADADARGADVVGEVEQRGGRALWVQVDVTDESAVHNLVEKTVGTMGRLDILACCAGVLGREMPFAQQTSVEFDRVMRVNVYGVYYAHQAALPHMLKQGWGRCVTITSGARHGVPLLVPYSVSKGAVYSLVQALGNAYPRQNVFVNGVEPGRVLTQMVVPRFSEEHLRDPGNPIGRYADAEEVAEVMEFLTSERNTYTTGAIWSVKGGAG
jgi:NAD(P)-dependent dehydrogenase (short-subunit alcohol dehydrogenase family)